MRGAIPFLASLGFAQKVGVSDLPGRFAALPSSLYGPETWVRGVRGDR